MRAWYSIGFGFYLFLVMTGVAGPLEDGNAALAKGDYDTAFKVLSPLAEEGNSTAQSALGFMYAFGRGVAPDAKAGVKWYLRSAEQGNAEAQSRAPRTMTIFRRIDRWRGGTVILAHSLS